MWGTCKIVNFSWLLFSTLVIGQNLLTQKKHPFKVDCKCILLRNRPSCRFTHSLCKNENIICGESTVAAYQNKLLSTLPGSLLNCLFPLDVQNEIQLLSGVFLPCEQRLHFRGMSWHAKSIASADNPSNPSRNLDE